MALDVPSPPIMEPLPRKDRVASNINTSINATNVTRNLYAHMNCFNGCPFQILVPMIGTIIPNGKTIVGLNSAVVCLDRPNSTAFKNLTLSLNAHGRRYVNKIRMRDCTAGSFTTAHRRRYVSAIPISYASNSSSSSSSSSCCCFFLGSNVSMSLLDLLPLLPSQTPTVHISPPSMLMSTSFLNNEINTVITSIKVPINLTNPPRLTSPTPGLLFIPNMGRHKFSLLSTSFNAKNPT
mmetsp:Transcript_28443/g.51874  ORF Transcript_28443/g.51874 Transcript_28443/m.51874 type:complete len:237 (+) Transcript_28443:493-1203(+)